MATYHSLKYNPAISLKKGSAKWHMLGKKPHSFSKHLNVFMKRTTIDYDDTVHNQISFLCPIQGKTG